LGNNKCNLKKGSTLKHAIMVALGTFFLAVAISSYSQIFLKSIDSLIFSFALLLVIIFIGIFFDIIGIAATAAEEAPFHARASRKLAGARQSIWMIRNADKVANFCNDVVGDICGTISGSIGALIVLSLTQYIKGWEDWIIGTVMVGLVAALTVGGKAAGKSAAINNADQIILYVGQAMSWFQKNPKKAKNKLERRGKGNK
jgi:CBS domain containing-hemolysin-like protein